MVKKLIIGGLVVILVGALGAGVYSYAQNFDNRPANQAGVHGNSDKQGYRSDPPGRGGQGSGEPQAHVEEWLTLSGELVSVDTAGLTLRTDDGRSVTLQLGPEWFWSEGMESLAPGEHVTVLAFEEDGEIKVGRISLEGDSYVLQLRDADGRPLWAGRGRGGGRR